jgi:hypothetical protein
MTYRALYAEECGKMQPGVTVGECRVIWGKVDKENERYAHFNVFIPIFLFNNPLDLRKNV